MDTTQLLPLLGIIVTLIGALLACLSSIVSAYIQRNKQKLNSDAAPELPERWKHGLADPSNASIEQRIYSAHVDAQLAKHPDGKLRIISGNDIDD